MNFVRFIYQVCVHSQNLSNAKNVRARDCVVTIFEIQKKWIVFVLNFVCEKNDLYRG